jgi:VID27 C-terminal WD40-like domain
VTSTGQYVIAWDFAKVKKGQMDKYEIKKYEDLVVQDNFRFGDDKQIVCPTHLSETIRSLIAFVVDCRAGEQCSKY